MDVSSLTPIALGFILIFALFGLLRGGLRVLASFVALALAGLLAFPLAPLLHGFVAATPVPLALQGAAALTLAGLGLFLFCRIAFGWLLSQRESRRRREGLPRHSALDRGLGAVLGAAWGCLIVVVVLSGLHLVSDVRTALELPPPELAATEEASPAEHEDTSAKRRAGSRGNDQVAAFLETEDPTTPSTLAPPPSPPSGQRVGSSLFDPLIERASPMGAHPGRALRDFLALLEDPESLDRLREQPEIRELMENPLIVEASSDPEIIRAVQRRDFLSLLDHPTIAKLANDPELRNQILALDFEDLLRRSRGS